MPIRISDNLPARQILEKERIFVMEENRALSQDIRALRLVILNLMPDKITTETQLLRALSNTPIQIDIDLLCMASHQSTHTSAAHLTKYYETFDKIKDQYFDGMIITGAPVEKLPFEKVDYWEELCQVLEWSKTHVYSTLHLCWAAFAGLYYHYGVPKYELPEKMFGVFRHTVEYKRSILFRGFDDCFWVPHSRHTSVKREELEKRPELKILASSPEAGVYAVMTDQGRQVFIMGHSEYDPLTLKEEYDRDVAKGLEIKVPVNYFPEDDPTKEPVVRWRAHANLLYCNWLNYFVYQTTPYDLNELKQG